MIFSQPHAVFVKQKLTRSETCSPIASLSYVLWNIKVTGKCALMSDMAIGLDEYGDEDSAFANTRDALFILSVMNQRLRLSPN